MKGKNLLMALFLTWTALVPPGIQGQNALDRFLTPADTFHPKRFRIAAGLGAGIYAGAAVGLWHAWYQQYELTGFHTFNDWGEWKDMDKGGHALTAYVESRYAFRGARWTGMSRRNAIWTGVGVGMLLQMTVEVMDGFSEKWGFSWGDVAFNGLGCGIFAAQELTWQEQRIKLKISSQPVDYRAVVVPSLNGGPPQTLLGRARDLYGHTFAETFLKDYNQLNYWLSFNIRSFLPKEKAGRFPAWLNLAAGYGAGNLYGGFENEWTDDAGFKYGLSAEIYPRFRRYLLGLDVDFSRIPTRSKLLRTLLEVINWIRIPGPVLELRSQGGIRFHPLFW